MSRKTTWRSDLEPAVRRCEARISVLLQKIVPAVRLDRIGPIDINGASWSCWIIVPTDKERQQLSEDKALLEALKLEAAEFPPDCFVFQSQETVDRDYCGNWFFAMR